MAVPARAVWLPAVQPQPARLEVDHRDAAARTQRASNACDEGTRILDVMIDGAHDDGVAAVIGQRGVGWRAFEDGDVLHAG